MPQKAILLWIILFKQIALDTEVKHKLIKAKQSISNALQTKEGEIRAKTFLTQARGEKKI